MRLLLVEPYHSGSHRAWAEGYAATSGHEVRLLTHPGRWWKWRMRGAAVTLAGSLADLDGWIPDAVLVSDMVDLGHFRTLARPFIGGAPTAIYFHKSQLTYPDPPGTTPDDSYALINWVSVLAADRVLFNSGYHQDAFFSALPGLLAKVPDLAHTRLIAGVEARSVVLPVGVDLSWVQARTDRDGPPRILWSHRWEFDKDPEAFADAIGRLVDRGRDFELVLLGTRPPHTPPALQRIRKVAADHIVYDGHAPTDLYRELVTASDIVVSTAIQEFFGISVVEATAAGCLPVLPRRLSYPWLIPDAFHDEVLYDEGQLAAALDRALERQRSPDGLANAMTRFSWEVLAPEYDRLLEELAQEG